MQIFEASKNYKVTFDYRSKPMSFTGTDAKEVFGPIVDWLYVNGYKFDNNLHSAFNRKLLTMSDINSNPKAEYYLKVFRIFHNVKGTDKWINLGSNLKPTISFVKKMLIKFGINDDTIKFEGFDEVELDSDKIKPFSKMFPKEETKMTFVKAAQIILQYNDNEPMSASEIWSQISDMELYKTDGSTPKSSLNTIMLAYSDNSNVKKKFKTKLFTIVDDDPAKFILINPEEIQDATEEELPEELPQLSPQTPNPFGGVDNSSAICILGESGVGKTTTTENYLSSKKHEYEVIIPSSTTTSLLAQYSPSNNKYVLSRLGRLLLEARNNPTQLYTAVIDECHKASTIDKINDELLQAISKTRNAGKRFISLDHDTADIYTNPTSFKLGLEGKGGNLLIPDNFGFIFLSSNDKVISKNHDFFNRVDIKIFTGEDDWNKGLEELHTLNREEKKKLREDGLSSIIGK